MQEALNLNITELASCVVHVLCGFMTVYLKTQRNCSLSWKRYGSTSCSCVASFWPPSIFTLNLRCIYIFRYKFKIGRFNSSTKLTTKMHCYLFQVSVIISYLLWTLWRIWNFFHKLNFQFWISSQCCCNISGKYWHNNTSITTYLVTFYCYS